MSKPTITARFRWLLGIGWIVGAGFSIAQPAPAPGTPVLLNDLSAFQSATPNWQIVGNVRAELGKPNAITTEKGTGVLANVPLAKMPEDPKNPSKYNLFTTFQHGDLDLELDYMIAPKSNSGLFLQGRYEIQLFDSWDNTGWDLHSPRVVDNGSIYERWDSKRPEGQNGYDGHPARQNASRAPGLWQHLKISFQAPRFNANGQKTANARMLRVELNGVVIHEDVELTGPTRAAGFDDEKAMGPLMLQGDHGPVAFRNIRYTSYDKPRPELVSLKYTIYKGKYEKEPEYDKIAPESEGTSPLLTAMVSRISNEFLIRYTGTLQVNEPGEYTFNLGVPGGSGMLKINNQSVIAPTDRSSKGKITLPKGNLPLELFYSKHVGWFQPALSLTVAGPGIREFLISDPTGINVDDVDPILVDASTNTILRSFMDLPGDKNTQGKRVRVTHAISVGSPEQIHYTYDLDKGALVQVWRGQFLDATPMWHDRGDGSSRPMGMVQRLGTPVLFLAKLASPQGNWPTDTTGSEYRPKGYMLDGSDRPTFRYQSFGSPVEDQIRVLEAGQGIKREVTVTNPASNLYARIASGNAISSLENGMYMVDGQEYVRIDDAGGAKPIIRDAGDQKELLVPVKGKLTYSILF
ncbi:family 16 glycoside hydrolase [Spirosoma sp. SC4-14]|uniref:family 16 glycoside hydrolase n=1 Tax=Spirosoma sp. SC4-14 TaxID=3128900 RepID=UPI0030D3D449